MRELKTQLVKAFINGAWTDVPALTGKQGDPGNPGAPGFSPTVQAQETDEGVHLIITDADGQRTALVPKGQPGSKGDKGDPGSDAEVTKANIERALSYTPASEQSVSDLEAQHERDVERLEQDIEQATPKDYEAVKRRLTNLEYAANGVLYREDVTESEDYEKPLAPDVMPYGTLDKIGGKTIVMNQLVGDTYPKAFEGEVKEQEITDKVKSVDVDSIDGKTVKWNQINSNNLAGGTRAGITFDKQSNGVWHVYGIPDGSTTNIFTNARYINGVNFFEEGHKYLFRGASANTSVYGFRGNQTMGRASAYGTEQLAVAGAVSTYDIIRINANPNAESIDEYVTPQCFDLTAMFGVGNEPTAEEFRALFPADYYPYSELALKNLDVQEVVSEGENLLDLKSWYENTKADHERLGLTFTYSETEDCWVINGTATTTAINVSWRLDTLIPYRDGITISCEYLGGTIQKAAGTGNYSLFYIGGGEKYGESSNWTTCDYLEQRNSKVALNWFKYVTRVWMYISAGVTFINYKVRPCIGYRETYRSYRAPETRDPSAIIAKYFPTGMKSAGTAHDIIDFKRGVAVQRVDRMDIPASAPVQITANATRIDCGWQFSRHALSRNVVMTGFEMSSIIVTNAVGEFAPRDNNKYITFGVPAEFSGDMTGAGEWIRSRAEYLYAELETYIETPIDPSDLDVLKSIPAEQGGTLTFNHIEGFNIPLRVTETLNLSEWSQPLDTTHKYNHNGSLLTATSEIDVVGGVDTIVDMTRAGCTDLNAYVNVEPVKNDGELVSKEFDSVVSRGKNLYSGTEMADIFAKRVKLISREGNVIVYSASAVNNVKVFENFRPNTQYYIKLVGDNSHASTKTTNLRLIYTDGTIGRFKSFVNGITELITLTGKSVDYIVGYWETSTTTLYLDECAICEGTAFAPYFKSTTPLSTIISKYFPNGMKSAGSVYDELDIENGVAVKRVNNAHVVWHDIGDGVYASDATYKDASGNNIVIPGYIKASSYSAALHTQGTYWMLSGKNIIICPYVANPSESDIVYELATPITTPIAPEDLEALRTLHVEAGGSLTFTDTNAGYHLPCVNKETFLVKTGGD